MSRALLSILAALLLATPSAAQEQTADPDFRPTVAHPAYATGRGPVIAIDEAHGNFHTAAGRYAPFAQLLALDGFQVRPIKAVLTAESLKGVAILAIVNPERQGAAAAFTEAECDAILAWVRAGGSLLLTADHAPFGAAAAPLAARFGVAMGRGWTYEPTADGRSITTQFVYSSANGRLGDHPITEGVSTIRAFTGQSLSVPPGATNLLRLADNAREAPDTDTLNAAAEAAQAGRPAPAATHAPAGPSQGLAMTLGKGRVVVLGEAAMFSAQVVTLPVPNGPPRVIRAGMNVPGYDNPQFALGVMRWLAGALD